MARLSRKITNKLQQSIGSEPMIASILLTVCLTFGCTSHEDRTSSSDVGNAEAARDVTFTRDIAPLVFDRCAPCHRPKGAAPFPLMSYDDIQKRLEQIVEVTDSGYMPPWLPKRIHEFPLRGDRSLSDTQKALFVRWGEQGCPEGDPKDLPEAPIWPDGWPIGPPDLVVKMPTPYVRPAGDRDLWRNFVLPVPTDRPRYVQLVDFMPGNAQAIHHAVIGVDTTAQSRAMDSEDEEAGYNAVRDGIVSLGSASSMVGDQFIGWLPGKIPDKDDFDQIWRMEPGSDLVLQLHLPAVGKDETIQSSIGLYFTDIPPKHITGSILLSGREIDIAPGVDDYVVEQAYRFPVPVVLTRIFPHAHYLCTEMYIYAKFPAGQEKLILHIPEWNFDWQDDYRYIEPIELPAGTEVRMHYRYNNTENNVRNPSIPPVRVVYGEDTKDSMADLLLFFNLRNRREEQVFRSDYLKFQFRLSYGRYKRAAARDPSDLLAHIRAGEAAILLGHQDEAKGYFERALEIDPDSADAHARVADILERERDIAGAIRELVRAIKLDAKNPHYRKQLGLILHRNGKLKQAAEQFTTYVELSPGDAEMYSHLGALNGMLGDLAASEKYLRMAIETDAKNVAAHVNLGKTLMDQGKRDAATVVLRRALELDSKNQRAWTLLNKAMK